MAADNILVNTQEINDKISSGVESSNATIGQLTDVVSTDENSLTTTIMSYIKGLIAQNKESADATIGQLTDPVSTDESSLTTTIMSYTKGLIAQNREYPKPMPESVSLTAGVLTTVKSSAGWVVATNSGILGDVEIINNTTTVWSGADYMGAQPFYCNNSIKLRSATGGTVNIVYL